ncbi:MULTISPECIES: hypothetical protein [unclassified Sphingomonas]|jgi:hypothetical protein|nr:MULTISPECIES: hypothetical protein [unclassified Sphingomonas]
MVKRRDGAKRVAVPNCDRAEVLHGKQVAFFRKGREKPVLVFQGHPGNETDITMDRIVVDEATAQPTTNGRCRFYGSAEGGVAMIVCFAAYGDGDNKRGAVAMMHVTTG